MIIIGNVNHRLSSTTFFDSLALRVNYFCLVTWLLGEQQMHQNQPKLTKSKMSQYYVPYRDHILTEGLFVTIELHQEPPPQTPTG